MVAVETELYGTARIAKLDNVAAEIEGMNLDKNDAILFKASRVVGLETIVNDIVV